MNDQQLEDWAQDQAQRIRKTREYLEQVSRAMVSDDYGHGARDLAAEALRKLNGED